MTAEEGMENKRKKGDFVFRYDIFGWQSIHYNCTTSIYYIYMNYYL